MKVLRTSLTVWLIVLNGAALALPTFLPVFKSEYKVPKGSALDKASCGTCHQGMNTKKFNPYGADLKKALEAAKTKKLTAAILKKVENLDSDKDGVKNGAEAKKGTLPGDPKSK